MTRSKRVNDSLPSLCGAQQMTSNDSLPRPSGVSASEQIAFDDFLKVDMRVGRVVQVESFPQASKPAFKLWIDFGALGIKTSSAQITALYTPESLLNRHVVAVVNFPPRQIATFMSEVLVLGAMPEADGVVLLHPDKSVPLGTRIG